MHANELLKSEHETSVVALKVPDDADLWRLWGAEFDQLWRVGHGTKS